MANIIINNKQYNNVPSVSFDKVGGGIATYTENGGSGVTIVQLDVNAAGTYNAPIDTAYNPVVVPSGTEGTPTATKGTVSGNAVTVTPSVTNTGGYISGSTKTGTGVTVSASELVSGTKTITSSGTTDVTNYANASVASGSVVVDNITLDETDLSMSASVSSSGLVTYNVGYQGYIDATVSAGYVSSYTSGGLEITATNTYQLSTQGATTFTPTTTDQTIASGKYLTGAQTIKGDANLIPANIADGVTIFGVTGTHSGGGGMSVVVTQDSHGGDIVTITGEEHRVAPFNDVNFFDYDGTIVYSYSASEFANLTALPANPTHSGLTAQGWNWTLADAKTQVADTGFLDIGQMYITSDGKTRIYITISDMAARSLKLLWTQSVASSVTIDWGDGSTTAAQSGTGNKNATHTYSSIGEYVIAMTVSSGTMTLGQGTSSTGCLITAVSGSVGINRYRAMCDKIEIGANCGVQNLYSTYVRTITIPKTLAQFGGTYDSKPLQFITIPTDCTEFATNYTFRYCTFHYISLPKKWTMPKNNNFQEASGLRRINLPAISAIPNSMLQSCISLSSLIIPSTVTTIGTSAFAGCTGLAEIHFKASTPPTVADSNAWTNLPTDCKIYVPSGKLSAYTSAQNYPSSSTYTYIEE